MKNLLKNALIPVLASRPVSAVADRIFGTGIPIFMLHRMVRDNEPGSGHTPSYIRRCLQFLKDNGHSFVSIDDIIEHRRGDSTLPPKPVAFTMDDGFEDQASLAAPVFKEFNCPVTIFLITGMLDGQLWPWFCKVEYLIKQSKADFLHLELPSGKETFDLSTPGKSQTSTIHILQAIKAVDWTNIPDILERLSDSTQVEIPATPPEEYRPISWDQARELEKQGISFGPHTISHPILSRVSDRQSEQEIIGSWQRLKAELSGPSNVFCYPNGRLSDFGDREIGILRESGFLGALSTVPDFAGKKKPEENDLYKLPRLGLPGMFPDFVQFCTWIEIAKKKFRQP